MTPSQPLSREGIFWGIAAYGAWGLVPLYFHQIRLVPPLETLAHRIIWSLVFLGLLLSSTRRWSAFGNIITQFRVMKWFLLSTMMIAVNWFVFIYGVSTQQVVQTSLGYFVAPLANMALGIFVYHERLRWLQWGALLLAMVGVFLMTLQGNGFPWIAITLAVSFSLYGLVRKSVAVDGVIALAIESLILMPFAVGYLGMLGYRGEMVFGAVHWQLDLWVVASGIVTAVPLICFAEAVMLLRLTTLGFLQYLSPSIALILGVWVLGETFTVSHWVSFTFIWAGLGLFVFDSIQGMQELRQRLLGNHDTSLATE